MVKGLLDGDNGAVDAGAVTPGRSKQHAARTLLGHVGRGVHRLSLRNRRSSAPARAGGDARPRVGGRWQAGPVSDTPQTPTPRAGDRRVSPTPGAGAGVGAGVGTTAEAAAVGAEPVTATTAATAARPLPPLSLIHI